jgi:hypothetical protein
MAKSLRKLCVQNLTIFGLLSGIRIKKLQQRRELFKPQLLLLLLLLLLLQVLLQRRNLKKLQLSMSSIIKFSL